MQEIQATEAIKFGLNLRVRQAEKRKPRTMKFWPGNHLVVCALVLVGLLSMISSGRNLVEANALLPEHAASSEAQQSQLIPVVAGGSGSSSFNNYDNLISDFLDDAGNRLKKSKSLNSMRQIKPTLRFGRRSDPMMMVQGVPQQQQQQVDALDYLDSVGLPYESNQRRRLAAAFYGREV